MKVYFNADLEGRNFEGRTSIALLIKKELSKQGCIFTDDPQDADLLHFHSSGILDSYRAYQYKKKYCKPTIFTLYSISETKIIDHARNHKDQKKLAKTYTGSFLLSYSAAIPIQLRGIYLRKLDAVVVASKYSQEKLFSNTRLIHFGIDTNKFYPMKGQRNESRIKVAYFGHPSSWKGIIDFCKASTLFAEGIDTYLFPSRITPELQATVQKINPKIHVQGFVKDVNKSYNDIDIILLPYRTMLGAISNPLVLLESMATKAAIVTTNLPFIKEITADAALLVKPYDYQNMARQINLLASNSLLRQQLGEKARQRIGKYYDQQVMLKQYHELYQTMGKK